ncbi:MAG: archaetidylserine decarboxylase [Pseudobdellovibrionaceae bacterium]
MSAITKFLPRNHLSYFVGKLVHWKGPGVWVQFSIWLFAKVYGINLQEAEKPASEYPSLGEFFVRRLKPGVRPLAQAPVVHPVDAHISQSGRIFEGRLIQAKGRDYFIRDLLVSSEAPKIYENGFFITYYLCPTDYHRVHAPLDGWIRKVTHVPGELWPVNKWSVENVHDLMSVNERIIVEMATDFGPVSVVLVGATNVGQIELSFDSSFRGNQLTLSKNRVVEYKTPLPIEKGQELGMFRMGSTVIMVYTEEFANCFAGKMNLDLFVKVNQALTK